MSIADQQKAKQLERKVAELEARVLLLEMQKRPVEPIGLPLPDMRPKITLPRKAAT